MRARLRSRRPARRGNYAILFVLMIPVILGFGALAVDISFMRLAQSQTQDVADAAGQAALLVLRRTADQAQSQAAAEAVVANNVIAGEAGTLDDIVFGVWDESAANPVFVPDNARPNAVRVRVTRADENAAPLFLARIWGYETFETAGTSTSAARTLHAILVMDITNSWAPTNFRNASTAAVRFLDTVAAANGPNDLLGMTIFTNRFGWEFTPFFQLDNAGQTAAARAQWAAMRTASKAGNGNNWPTACNLNTGSNQNNFNSPAGGCYPNMPREYRDEPGTDHTTGLMMARTMFLEQADPTAFRVQLILTDGQPNGIGAAGTTRGSQGFVESRWREYLGPVPHTSNAIRTDTIALSQQMWDDLRVHTYIISFVSDDWFMHDVPQGQGYYVLTSNSASLIPIFEDVANSLPMAIVE
jgi:Flp pilus assembly protein TadG